MKNQWGRRVKLFLGSKSRPPQVGAASQGGLGTLRGGREPVRSSWVLYITGMSLDFILSSVESCWMTWSQTRDHCEQMNGFILAGMWRRGEKWTHVEVGDEALAGKIALGSYHSLPRSTLHPFLSCCLPQRLAYRHPCLLTSSWVQPMGSLSQSLEEGRREKLEYLLPQLLTSPVPGV